MSDGGCRSRSMRTWVHSRQLQFTREGRTLVVAEPDGVAFIDPLNAGESEPARLLTGKIRMTIVAGRIAKEF